MLFTAGQRIAASDLNTATQQAAWTAYTPTWSSSGTSPSVGNGNIRGYYGKVGRLVVAKIALNTGSTTTYGSGDYFFSLPFTAAVTNISSGQFAHAGTWLLGNNGATFYTANALVLQSAPNSVYGILNGSGVFMGASNPVAFTGANSQFVCTLAYESTS